MKRLLFSVAALLLAAMSSPALANDWRGGVVTILNGRGFLTYKLIEVNEKPTERFAVGYVLEGSTTTSDGKTLPSAGWIDCKDGYYEFLSLIHI